MKFLTTLILLLSFTCFSQENDKRGTIKVTKQKSTMNTSKNDAVKSENTENVIMYSNQLIPNIIEQIPTYKGGEVAFNSFIRSNLIYPKSAKDANITGICYMNMIVEQNGQISNIRIIKGIRNCLDCDKEALRIVKLMPAWNPATQNGKPVKVQMNIPIKFLLK